MGRAATAAAARPKEATPGRTGRVRDRVRRRPSAADGPASTSSAAAGMHRRVSGRHGAGRAAAAAAALSSAIAVPVRVANAPFGRAVRARTAGLLDALLAGRGWIALIGVLLAGIVFFNVDLLQMNRDIARDAEKASALGRENARLRLTLARLGSSERIQEAAAGLGLVLPAPGEVRYLKARPAVDARRAAKRITEPNDSLAPPVPSAATTLLPETGMPTTTPPATTPPTTTTPPAGTTATAPPAGTTTPPATTTPPTTTAPPVTTTPAVPQTTTPPTATDPTTGLPTG
jgi:cell division protein FtsL